MSRIAACLLVSALACGRLGFDPTTMGGDANTDGLGIVPCPLVPTITLGPASSGPFGAPVLITELSSTADEDDPTLTGDELEIYFQTNRDGPLRIYRSVRALATDPWPAPTPVVELDGLDANTPEISRDGLRLRFAGSGGGADIFMTQRSDRASPWQPPQPVAELNTSFADTGAVEFLDGYALAFASTRPGGVPPVDLWEVVRIGADCSATSLAVFTGAITQTTGKANPWMRNDGLTVVFPADGGALASELHVASRSTLWGPFDPAVRLTELSTASVEDDPWLNDAMTNIYFVSARQTSGVDLYIATR